MTITAVLSQVVHAQNVFYCICTMCYSAYTLTKTLTGCVDRAGSCVQSTDRTAEKRVKTCQSKLRVMQLITRVSSWVWLLQAARKRNKHWAEAPTHGLQYMVTKNRTHTFARFLHGPARRGPSGNQMCSCGIETCARGMPSSNHELGQLPYVKTGEN